MLPLKQSVADWITVRIEGADGVGVTGLVYNSAGLSAKLAKAGGAAATKTLGAGEFVEQANGYYWIKLLAGDLDTVGPGTLIVIYQGAEIAVPFRVSAALVDDVQAGVARLLGLSRDNAVLDQCVYSSGVLTSGRLRCYDSKANADAAGATGLLFTYLISATPNGGGQVTDFKITRDA